MCMFYRSPSGETYNVQEAVKAGLEQQIVQALANGYTTFITGLAQGVDLWAGKIVADLRDNGLPIKLVAVNPYPGFGKDGNRNGNLFIRKLQRGQILSKMFAKRIIRVASWPGTNGW